MKFRIKYQVNGRGDKIFEFIGTEEEWEKKIKEQGGGSYIILSKEPISQVV